MTPIHAFAAAFAILFLMEAWIDYEYYLEGYSDGAKDALIHTCSAWAITAGLLLL